MKGKPEFFITNHAANRWRKKLSNYFNNIPLWKAVEKSRLATEDLKTKLDIQYINKTAMPRMVTNTYYFVYRYAVFVCKKENINRYVVQTCWELEK
jgi:hypothetical protein